MLSTERRALLRSTPAVGKLAVVGRFGWAVEVEVEVGEGGGSWRFDS